jgi:diacylglycerol kinase (ATP)
MAKPGATGLTRIIDAFGYSMKGMRAALRYESAFRQEAALFVILLPAAFWLGQSWLQYILLIGSLLLVLIVELLNSAIEAVVDRIGDEHHELAGRAKDMGSAAVFISLANVFFIWAVIAYLRYLH